MQVRQCIPQEVLSSALNVEVHRELERPRLGMHNPLDKYAQVCAHTQALNLFFIPLCLSNFKIKILQQIHILMTISFFN